MQIMNLPIMIFFQTLVITVITNSAKLFDTPMVEEEIDERYTLDATIYLLL